MSVRDEEEVYPDFVVVKGTAVQVLTLRVALEKESFK